MECGAQSVIQDGMILRPIQFVDSYNIQVFTYYSSDITLLIYLDGVPLSNSYFGIGTTPLHIYYSYCNYYSTSFSSCSLTRSPYYYSYCNNYHEAGVRCERKMYNFVV